jgi:hypothetical protein
MKTQWECFLQNIGTWQGSFATFSTAGELVEDIPSLLQLEQVEERKAKLTLKRESPKFPEPLVMEFSNFNQSLVFFETGAFSQGGLQLGVGQFGAEFGLVNHLGDRRMRLVQLYNDAYEVPALTLIREKNPTSNTPEQPRLQVEDLEGEWAGEAVTMFPDLREPLRFTSHLQMRREGDRLLQQLSFGDRTITTEAAIVGNVLLYDQNALPVRIVLLPDGASANFPLKATVGQPFVLEAGWLMAPGLRQRIMRNYDAKGEWVNTTLVTERKVGS